MPDSKKYLHPETIQRIARLELRARYIVEGFLAGTHRSPYFGQSVEFLQHRQYTTGDDLRHVDWKVWARNDRLYVKQFEEDTNLRCNLLVDVSASMSYGRGPLNKYDYACTAAASLAYLVLKQHDAVGCVTFDRQIRQQVPVRSRQRQLQDVVEALKQQPLEEKTGLYDVLHQVAQSMPQRGLMVLISDLLADPESTVRGLRLLRQRGHDVLVIHVLDDDELDFPFNGATRFEGLETLDHLTCNPRALREGYLQAVERYLSHLRRACATLAIDYLLMRTRQPMGPILATMLSKRMSRAARR
jgi:uncharacterized protein (DUF58 family)